LLVGLILLSENLLGAGFYDASVYVPSLIENDVCEVLNMLAFFRIFELLVSSICLTFAIVNFIGPFLGIIFLVTDKADGSDNTVVYYPRIVILFFLSLIDYNPYPGS
jgi:hypothetical protein